MVVSGTEEVSSSTASKALDKMSLGHNAHATNAEYTSVDVERQETSTSDSTEVQGRFATSAVPTIEEKTVAEHQWPEYRNNVSLEKDGVQHHAVTDGPHTEKDSTRIANGTVNGEHAVWSEDQTSLGASPQAAPPTHIDHRSPHTSGEFDSTSSEEKPVPTARATIRKHLDHGSWTLPIPRPRVDAEGFKDPISDAFWKDVWIASASYNVCNLFL